jgi:hypothetical protein
MTRERRMSIHSGDHAATSSFIRLGRGTVYQRGCCGHCGEGSLNTSEKRTDP